MAFIISFNKINLQINGDYMSSKENQLRVLKRDPSKRFQPIYNPNLQIGSDYIPELIETEEFQTLKKEVGHVSMKKESKVLRKIMSQNKISKRDVLDKLLYQHELKSVGEDKSVLTLEEKNFLRNYKEAMAESNLPVWDSKTIEILKENLKCKIELYLSKNALPDYPCDCCGEYYPYLNVKDYVFFRQNRLALTDDAKNYKEILYDSDKKIIKKYMLLKKKQKLK